MDDARNDGPLPDADAAIYAFRRNVVVAASAGTGKTYRLTALYVLLALGLTSMGQEDDRTAAPPVGPERIVATTFSRAAAAEIAARVERALGEIAGWDGQAALAFGRVIGARAGALGQRVDPGELKKRANDALGRWPYARIDTLHGVARRVVQRNALALGLSPGTRVLDEEEAQALSDLAVDEALGDALTAGGERAEAARALVVSAGGVWSTRLRVQRLLDRLDEEGLAPSDLALADHLADGRAVRDELLALARRLVSLGAPSFRDPAATLASALETAGPDDLLPAGAEAAIVDLFTKRMPPRGRRLPPDDELDDFIGGLPGKTKGERATGLVSLLRHAPGLRAKEARLVELIEDARTRLAAGKRRAGALGFGDLLRTARDALRDRPEIARAVREDVDVLLVDEFQDTSRVQRDLVYLLREREDSGRARGASPEARGLAPHGLFLVGDRKQSIYGFRGADVAVFSRIAAELAGRAAAEALALPFEDDAAGHEPVADFAALTESRRSGEAILAFVNAFSERDFTGDRPHGTPPRPFEIAYGPAEHLVPAADVHTGRGRAVFLPDDGTSPEGADPIVRESSGAAREAHLAAAFVEGLTRPGGEVAASYKDVAILTRRRSTIPLVELALGRLDIPYVVAGRALYDAPEVRDVTALLRLLLDPRDRLAMATVLRGPMVALSDTALADLSLPGKGLSVPVLGRWPTARPSSDPAVPPPDVVDPSRLTPAERGRLDGFRARFAEIRGALLRLPPGEAIRTAMAAFDLDRVICALPRAEARIGNLDRLVTIARRRGGTLAAFVRWVERRMRDDADEAEAAVFSPEDDAVRLTTIHASKGLDFPVVVLVDLNAEPRGDHGGIGFVTDGEEARLVVRHYAPRGGGRALAPLATAALRAAQAEARAREQAERRRLTYVALTRARHTLVLVGSAADPRPASALRSLASGIAQGDLAGVVEEAGPASDLLASARPAPPRPASPIPAEARAAPPRPRASPAREIAIDAASLPHFHECPRRYRLRVLLGIEEPAGASQLDLFSAGAPPEPIADLPPPIADDPALDPLPARRAPERVDAIARFLDGPFGSHARQEEAATLVDEPFVVHAGNSWSGGRRVIVRGVWEVRVDRPGDRVDVIAVSAGRPRVDLGAHEIVARAAALGVAQEIPSASVRAGVLFLEQGEVRWLRGAGPDGALTAEEHVRFEAEVAALGRRVAEAIHEERFEGIARPRCEALGCGFVAACHGGPAT